MLKAALSGNYVNFGVFRLYGDTALDDTFQTFVKLLLSITQNNLLVSNCWNLLLEKIFDLQCVSEIGWRMWKWCDRYTTSLISFLANWLYIRNPVFNKLSVFIDRLLSGYFYNTSQSPLLRGAPDTARIMCWSFTLWAPQATEGLAQGPYMVARAGFEPATPDARHWTYHWATMPHIVLLYNASYF